MRKEPDYLIINENGEVIFVTDDVGTDGRDYRFSEDGKTVARTSGGGCTDRYIDGEFTPWLNPYTVTKVSEKKVQDITNSLDQYFSEIEIIMKLCRFIEFLKPIVGNPVLEHDFKAVETLHNEMKSVMNMLETK